MRIEQVSKGLSLESFQRSHIPANANNYLRLIRSGAHQTAALD